MNIQLKMGLLRAGIVGSVAVTAAAGLGAKPALASSDFAQGKFVESDPVGPSFNDKGVCSFVVGPRDGMAADAFELTAGDANSVDEAEIKLTGTFSTAAVGRTTVFTLNADPASAGKYAESVLRRQMNDPAATFLLTAVTATVTHSKLRSICSVSIKGMVSAGGVPPSAASFSFSGDGEYYPSYADTAPASAAARPSQGDPAPDNSLPCPTTLPVQKALAPLGIAPIPGKCSTSDCLVDFAGYKWWTSFQYYGPANNPVFPGGGYFYNADLLTAFAPSNVTADSQGLHLTVQKKDLGGGTQIWTGAEAVLMFDKNYKQVNLGYGDYLVQATINTASDWVSLDPNVALGVFQFERVGSGSIGPSPNPWREIDLAEISSWGNYGSGPQCPYKGAALPLCTGNAQFTLQKWDANPNNLNRYTFTSPPKTVTLVMHWTGANEPVTFSEYNGAYALNSLPPQADYEWTTKAGQNQYVPESGCGRFHINFWMGNRPKESGGYSPGPAVPQEAVITKFQFKKI